MLLLCEIHLVCQAVALVRLLRLQPTYNAHTAQNVPVRVTNAIYLISSLVIVHSGDRQVRLTDIRIRATTFWCGVEWVCTRCAAHFSLFANLCVIFVLFTTYKYAVFYTNIYQFFFNWIYLRINSLYANWLRGTGALPTKMSTIESLLKW